MARRKRAIDLGDEKAPSETRRKIEKVNFRYIFPDTYNPQYANGAHGGPTTQGEIAINFFVERSPLPIEETYAIGQDGALAGKIGREPEIEVGTGMVVRYVTTGVIMSRDSAQRIYDFLGQAIAKIDMVRSRKEQDAEKGGGS